MGKRIWFMLYCFRQSLRHPFGEVTCLLPNPGTVTTSALPWWGSGLLIVLGIATWIVSAIYSIEGMAEAGRALVYLPLGNMFGMTQILLRGRPPELREKEK